MLHELVRQYAAEQLIGQPHEAMQTHARHAAYYAAFAEQRTCALRQNRQALNEMNDEVANIRTAWDWAASQPQVDLLDQLRNALAVYFEIMGLFQEATATFERAARGVRAALADASTPAPMLQIALGYLLAETAHWLIRQALYDGARPCLQEAYDLAQATGSTQLESYSSYHLGELYQNQSNYSAAQPHLTQALTLARQRRLRDVEAGCLRSLGKIAEEQGNYAEANAHYEQAAVCYRECGDRLGQGQIYGLLGRIASDQGSFARARVYYDHHLRISREIGDRRWEAVALTLVGILKEDLGHYTEADSNFGRALQIAQELGDRRGEGITLASLGRNALIQGDFARAQAHYDQSLHIYREIGYQVGESFVLGDLGLLAHYQGDDQQAWDLGRQVLEVAQQVGNERRQRFALMVLGHALTGLGRLTDAAAAYQQALALNRKLGYAHLIVEATAGLARVALAKEELIRAVAHVDTIFDHVRTSSLDGTEEPLRVFLTCAEVLLATQDPRASTVLEAGYRRMRARAASIADTDRRRKFFENIPAHREMLRLWQARMTSTNI
jgi:tetratricopeptide (TPR) repeat protein